MNLDAREYQKKITPLREAVLYFETAMKSPNMLTFRKGDAIKFKVEQRPRLLSDNGPYYVASDLGEWLEKYKIDQVHGAAGHPQTQGKTERWRQTIKNRILLERERIKKETIRQRRLNHHAKAA